MSVRLLDLNPVMTGPWQTLGASTIRFDETALLMLVVAFTLGMRVREAM